jgi:hypothetical protein
MLASRNLNELDLDVQEEIKLLAVRVTLGLPAFRSLKTVLNVAEWQQIVPELSRYFPPSKPEIPVSFAEARGRKPTLVAGESVDVAVAPGLEPPEGEQARPSFCAIKTLMRVRRISQCRAILELTLANELITDAGYRRLLRAIGEQVILPPSNASPKLEWDKAICELRLNGKVVKRVRGVKVAKKNVVAVLDCFEEEEWPRRIHDPLPPSKALSKRLHDTIASLNSDLVGLRFRTDGSGENVCWDLAPSS